MWGLLRIILLIGNALLLAWIGYLFFTASHTSTKWWEYLFAYGLMTCLALNFVYLLLREGKGANWRILRLIGLWFDAKESELRQRADQSRRDK
jgi:hypothetical protein